MSPQPEKRFKPEDLEAWRRDGITVIREFFDTEEVAAVHADFEKVFERRSGAVEPTNTKQTGQIGDFNEAQFKSSEIAPFDCSPALNLIGVHPALVAFAKEALETDAVHLYQFQAWAKFTGDADYDQPFHCDFSNHTLTVPSEDAASNTVTILCYFNDVTDAHGAMHYVTRPDSDPIVGPETSLPDIVHRVDRSILARQQEDLKAHERSSASPAGSIVPYAIDVYHRGTNLTAPNGYRYAVMACFKIAGDDSFGFHAWPTDSSKPWTRIFNHASPEQLACFGVKAPGDPFWTETTLARAQVRYPEWDLTPYRAALKS